MRGRTCDYVKPNGKFCGSLALRGRDYCYFHLTCVGRKLRAEKQFMITGEPPLELPPLEDINSIQIAIMQVGDALLRHRINSKTSGQLLYLLSLAMQNIKLGVDFNSDSRQPEDAEEEAQPEPEVLCDCYPSFEADYELTDLAAELGCSGERQEPAGENAEAASPEEQAEQGAGQSAAVEEELPPTTKAAGPQRVLFGVPKPPPSVYANWWKMRQEYFTAAWAKLEAESARTGPIRSSEKAPATAKG